MNACMADRWEDFAANMEDATGGEGDRERKRQGDRERGREGDRERGVFRRGGVILILIREDIYRVHLQ